MQKKNKIQLGKVVKSALFASDKVLYLDDPIDYHKRLSELINEFSNVEGYKINI